MFEMAPRISRKDFESHSIMFDNERIIKYRRKKKNRQRRYYISIHRNNNNDVYCATYGYYKNNKFHRLWLSTSFDVVELKEELMVLYENHLDIVLGSIRIVKIKPSLLDSGYLPVQESGEVISRRFTQSTFFVIENKKKNDYGLHIQAKDGTEFKVPSECFIRTYPTNWFLI